ncbi:MAG: DTW domain-containing protein [Cellvibrio sp. 79]|nr:MAG: DTW domain-containing protein [Cellvibrio sp. 79]
MTNTTHRNQFLSLRSRRIAEATREFLARGKSVIRCEDCQLAAYACICQWRPTLETRSEFILLMHRDEVLKPTNTGRLIADVLPARTHVFCWSRTEPDKALVKLLSDPQRRCLIVFPEEANDAAANSRELVSELPIDERINTFVLLDGTWKQSGRMFHLSRWLDAFSCVVLPETDGRGYAVRKSHQDNYLSTAEAAALCLQMANELTASEVLLDYFQLFNLHYLATRACVPPEKGELHERLAQLMGK